MDAAARERYRKRLAEVKAEILSEGDIEIEPARRDPTATTVDDDAQPLVEMSQAIASSRNRNRAQVLGRVVAALGRLTETADADADSAFGLCIECEEPIAPKRLELMPYVELCVECQQTKDGPKAPTSRRHLRDFK